MVVHLQCHVCAHKKVDVLAFSRSINVWHFRLQNKSNMDKFTNVQTPAVLASNDIMSVQSAQNKTRIIAFVQEALFASIK